MNWVHGVIILVSGVGVGAGIVGMWLEAEWVEINKSKFMARLSERNKIARYITSRMKTVSPSLSAAQALDDLRMAVESGDYEATP